MFTSRLPSVDAVHHRHWWFALPRETVQSVVREDTQRKVSQLILFTVIFQLVVLQPYVAEQRLEKLIPPGLYI